MSRALIARQGIDAFRKAQVSFARAAVASADPEEFQRHTITASRHVIDGRDAVIRLTPGSRRLSEDLKDLFLAGPLLSGAAAAAKTSERAETAQQLAPAAESKLDEAIRALQ